MDRLLWLNSAPWLVLLGSETLHELRKTCNFHPILTDAVCCFQSGVGVGVGVREKELAPRRFLWFAPAASNVDCTQLFLEVSLLIYSSDTSKPPGLVFCIDNATFLVDHTVMGEIDVPNGLQENVEALHGPRYAAILWPAGIQMRLFLPPGTADTASIEKLTQCVESMIAYLRAEHFHHPALVSLRKGRDLQGQGGGIDNNSNNNNHIHQHHIHQATDATPTCPRPLPTQSPPLGQYQPSSSSSSSSSSSGRGAGKRARLGHGNDGNGIGNGLGGDEGDPKTLATVTAAKEQEEPGAQTVNNDGDVPAALQQALRDWLLIGQVADRILSPIISSDTAMQAVLSGGSASSGTGVTALAAAAAEREAAIRALLSSAPAASPRRSTDYDLLLRLQSCLLSAHAAAELEQTIHARALGVRADVARLLDCLYGPAAPGFAPAGCDGGQQSGGNSNSNSGGSSSSSVNSSSTRDGGMGLDYGADDGLGLSPAQSGSQHDRGGPSDADSHHGPAPSTPPPPALAAATSASTPAPAPSAAVPPRATSEAERRAAVARIDAELTLLRDYSHASAVLRSLPRQESFFCD